MSGALMAACIASGSGSGVLSVSVTPPAASGGGVTGGHVGSVTAIGAGGVGGYTYAWTIIADDVGYPLTINSPAAATTDFDFAEVDPMQVATATVRVTVTSGAETAYADVTVTFRNRDVSSTL